MIAMYKKNHHWKRHNLVLCTLFLLVFANVTGLIGVTQLVDAQIPEAVLRGDILIVDGEVTRKMNPYDFNDIKPGAWTGNLAGNSLYTENLTGEMGLPYSIAPLLAAEDPQYSEEYTKLRISLRQGVYFSDGVEFTSEDAVFSIMLQKNTAGALLHGEIDAWIESVEAVDKYTVDITLTKPNPKIHTTTLITIPILPKHVWEAIEDPLTFDNYPPVGTGAYVVQDVDPNGYWALWERREDWERSITGVLFGEQGKPKPKYILNRRFETEEKRILAFARNELDWAETSFEGFEELRRMNPYVRSMYETFPYRWSGGNCDHGVSYNNAKYPYNITDVRWALALAINMTEVQIVAMNCMARMGTWRCGSVLSVVGTLEPLLLPQMADFALPDGYKPWDPTVPDKIEAYLKSQGITLPAPASEIYGPGWWKYDPEKAAELLEKHGFYRDGDSKWHLPDGSLWEIYMPVSNFITMVEKLSFGVTEEWTKFGLTVTVDSLDAAMYFSKILPGDFDICGSWPFCARMPDFTAGFTTMKFFHEQYYKPIGESVGAWTQNHIRWKNPEVTAMLDEMESLPTDDPRVAQLCAEIIIKSFEDMPAVNMFIGSKVWTANRYVWKNWPAAENPYWTIYPRGSFAIYVVPFLVPSGNVPSSEIIGPSPETIEEMQQAITDIKTTASALQETVSAQASLINTVMTIAAIDLIVAVVAIILVFRYRK